MTPLNTTPPRSINSSSLSEWSKQEIFDYTMSKWAERNFRLALNDAGACVYRGAPAGPCLIGLMIPDSCYNSSLEGQPFSRIYDQFDPDMPSDRFSFLNDLQALHDSTPRNCRLWPRYLNEKIRQLAQEYKLALPDGVDKRLMALGKEIC